MFMPWRRQYLTRAHLSNPGPPYAAKSLRPDLSHSRRFRPLRHRRLEGLSSDVIKHPLMRFNLPQALKFEAELKQIKENKAKAAVPKF
jgi:hypothetical protein